MIKITETPSHSGNYIKGVLDEIALEGLEGITPNDLWVRLNERHHFTIRPKDDVSKLYLWETVKRLKSVRFYELPEPRPPLVLFDRFEHIDPVIGMVYEPENMPQNIYPHCKVEDPAAGVVGSCATYYSRKDVTEEVQAESLTYKDVDKKWGHRLVIVASQSARRAALFNPDVNPNLELTTMQYLVLERVGRSRYHGEITQGRDSLQIIGEDAKSIFYLRKVLHKHRLITKQMFHQKLGSQNACGLLLHLPRFFVERRPVALALTEKVVSYLKSKPPLFMEEYAILRQDPDLSLALKKLSKTLHFQKFIKSDMIPYRTLYPEATESEWRYKGANKEKSVRVLGLIDATINPRDVWQKYEDIYDDEDDDIYGYLNENQRYLDCSLIAQSYRIVEARGPAGITQVDLGAQLGASKLAARMLIRNLNKSDKLTRYMQDEGRQRTARFALKIFDKCSDVKKQMTEEKDKHLKLVKMGVGPEGSQNLENKTKPQIVKLKKSTQPDNNLEAIQLSPAKSKNLPSVNSGLTEMEVDTHNRNDTMTEPTLQSQRDVEESLTKPSEDSVKETLTINTEIVKRKGKKRNIKETKDTSENEAPKSKKIKGSTEKLSIVNSETNAVQEIKEGTVLGDVPEKEEIQLVISTPDLSNLTRRGLSKNTTPIPENLKKDTSLSFRMLKRTNLIMEMVHKYQVVFDTCKLQKMIYEEEFKEGYDVRMDKKSLLRIVNKLSMEGHVKHIQMTLSGYGKEKVLTFICHPSVTTDHSVIQSAIDQAKMKFHILGREAMVKKAKIKKKMEAMGSPKVAGVHMEMIPSLTKSDTCEFKYNRQVGRIYGFKPKYMRMQVLHKYMFYLTYGYEGDGALDQEKAIEVLKTHVKVIDELRADLSQIYLTSMDWKMFLPPLPSHAGYSDGWAFMSDLLLRLPLSIFVQVVNVSHELPELEAYINHPVKKHFLVKNLPLHIKKTLTFARKYIFTIHEQVIRLCCTGLLQLGPQRLKEKDQVFVYMNRHSILWDTTSSPAGYHQIASDRDYPVQHYNLLSMADVDQYWYDMWNYCMHTMLGGRTCMNGQEVVVDSLQNKPQMAEALESQSVEEALARDIGYLPGDHLGAAGFDSAMFAHLKRNWYWNTTKVHLGSNAGPAPAPSTELPPCISLSKQIEERMPFRVFSETSSAKRRLGGRRIERQGEASKEKQRLHIKRQPRAKQIVRMLKYRQTNPRKPYYDQVDREALLKMSKLRVDWTSREDNLLLLCKVASLIFQTVGKRYLNLIVVREILHEQFPEATDKTSRACQRRLNYMMKNTQTQRSVELCVEEMKQDSVVMNRLKGLVEEVTREGKSQDNESQWSASYKSLVLLLQERYKKLYSQELTCLSEGFLLPNSVKELKEKYRIILPQKHKDRSGFSDVHTVTDIHSGVINSIILSALNCLVEKISWTYQLFSIYQQYPDKLLRAVMAKTRSDQMVSLRKRYLRTHIRSGDYLPLSSSPYQISISYINLLMTRYKPEIYGDCLLTYRQLAAASTREDPYEEVVAAKGGAAACIVELTTQELIDFKLDIPNQIIVMDPKNQKEDETYARIISRYHDILTKSREAYRLSEDYNTAADNNELELEEAEDKLPLVNIGKAATRISLYMTREKDEGDKVVDQQEMQHVHDYFLVNSTRVFCNFLQSKSCSEENPNQCTPLPQEIINRLLNKIIKLAVFPEKSEYEPDLTKEVSAELGESQEFVDNLLEFVAGKNILGATVEDVRDVYGTDRRVMRALKALTEAQALLYCGVTRTHWVHRDHIKPWVVRTHRLVRSQRENLIIPEVVRGLIMNVGKKFDKEESMEQVSEEHMEVDEVADHSSEVPFSNISTPLSSHQPHSLSPAHSPTHPDSIINEVLPQSSPSTHNPPTLCLPHADNSTRECITETSSLTQNPPPQSDPCSHKNVSLISSSTHNPPTIYPPQNNSSTNKSSSQISSSTHILHPDTSTSESFTQNSSSTYNPPPLSPQHLEPSTSEALPQCNISSTPIPPPLSPPHPVPSISEGSPQTSSSTLNLLPLPSPHAVPSTSKCVSPPPLPPRSRRPPPFADSNLSDDVQSLGKHYRAPAKFLNIYSKKFKKAPALENKSKLDLNVVVRPWIRINGSLNKRVLSKFLTSILGHIMTLPLCSIKMVQERFSPAFQPHHTRELVEMLAEIKCIRILAVKHSHKCSLFSEPTIVSSVVATGLEREEDIILEPDPMAISHLSGFIGDCAFLSDLYADKTASE